jgi:hypothetical protein
MASLFEVNPVLKAAGTSLSIDRSTAASNPSQTSVGALNVTTPGPLPGSPAVA